MSRAIKYSILSNDSKYKYKLSENFYERTEILPKEKLFISDLSKMGKIYVSLATDGLLTIHSDYAWDGPSGPTIDTPDFLIASLVHDAIYQMLREKKLPQSIRKTADQIMRRICIEEGMSNLRAFYVYWAVRAFGSSSAK